ncbi:MAG: hypothetical protein C4291_12335 [Candidatus Dadabacteria bacterium]
MARSFKEVHYIYQSNQGVAVASNVGITAAQGEVIAFLEADEYSYSLSADRKRNQKTKVNSIKNKDNDK